MHQLNADFWRHVGAEYGCFFLRQGLRVLEVGSCNVNGSVRDYLDLSGCVEYVGVDWRPGPCVDVVCLAHEIDFGRQFDVVISCSMLEHDPHWERSIPRMVEHLKDDGMLCLSWGAALNQPHAEETATDGCFHSLPAGRVLRLLADLGMYVHEFVYEGLHFAEGHNLPPDAGMGEVCVVAFKDYAFHVGERRVDPLLPEDA